MEVIVIGAGLSGLVCAWRLAGAGIDVVCLEATDRVGGALRTHRRDGFVAEAGATTVQETAELAALIRDLDLVSEMRRTAPGLARFIYRGGELRRLPQSIAQMLTTRVVSPAAKLRILGEVTIARRREESEESVAAFITRRFGAEALDALVAPFVSGTFAGDPAKLGAAAAFPRLVALERRSGSILRGLVAAGAGASGALVSFRGGVESLAERVAEKLGDRLRRRSPVTRIVASDAGYRVTLRDEQALTAAGIVLAVPAWTAAELLREIVPGTSAALAEIDAPPLACVSVSWPADRITHSLDGFGFLVAPGENVRILGCLWPSSMFEGRAPAGQALLTCFVGGARDPAAAALDDEALVALVTADLAKILDAGGKPRVVAVDRYERAIPQYAIGHSARVDRIRAGLATASGIFLCGNYLDGIAVGEAVRQGMAAAKQVENQS